MTFDIIGAGIGGLTTAIALEQKGLTTRLFEQAKEIKPVGAGIIMANNAMQVFQKLGIRDEIEQNGNPISSIKITRPNLKPISELDLSYFEKKYKVKNVAIHRGVLQKLLMDRLGETEVHLDHQLKNLRQHASQLSLVFQNDKTYESTVLLGADGLNSVVRKNILPNNQIRKAGQQCWRGIANFDLPANMNHELNEAWGKNDRFGFVQISKGKVYWYALKTLRKDDTASSRNINDYFSGYHPIICDILVTTPTDQINEAEISDLKPTKTWYKDNVCLLGDAAHATTPNMGQGACQAVEDAYVLSEYLDRYDRYEIQKAFSEFQRRRLKKAHHVVKTSWRLGKLAHLSNPALIELRNQMIRLTPNSINRKQSDKTFRLAKI